MIAGGFDDISEEGSYEFANMKATSNAETEFAMGREPTEMSRPATTSRAGVSYFDIAIIQQLIFFLVYGISGVQLLTLGSSKYSTLHRVLVFISL